MRCSNAVGWAGCGTWTGRPVSLSATSVTVQGELVHVDIKKLGKVPDGGGWRARGRGRAGPTQRGGYEYVHSMVDDHSRFAYSEIHDNQRSETCAAFILRAAQTYGPTLHRHSHRPTAPRPDPAARALGAQPRTDLRPAPDEVVSVRSFR